MATLTRREWLLGAAALSCFDTGYAQDAPGQRLTAWRPGMLDIHHLATGRGDATLIVCPDGTTILVDAGATEQSDPALLPALPNAQRRPGEWIARYVQRRLAETTRAALDTLLVTHLHPDHIGGVGERTPAAPSGDYRLTGVADVGTALPVRRVVDPDYPDYGYPPFEDAAASQNYIAYIQHRLRRGESVERFRVGARDQLRLEHGAAEVPFEIRNLACKGIVWSRATGSVEQKFPAADRLPSSDYPNVNAGSSAIRLSLGPFSYFIAGDLTDWADAGTRPWMDALTPAAQAAGPVSVAVTPHHGLFDASGSAMVAALAAKVWVISAWHASHPSITTLERLFNERLYAGPRHVYATGLAAEADVTQGRLTRRLQTRAGHVIVRVAPDGRTFHVVVTSAADERDVVQYTSPVIAS